MKDKPHEEKEDYIVILIIGIVCIAGGVLFVISMVI